MQQLLEEGCKEGVPVVLSRHIHGAQHPLVDVDWACKQYSRTSTLREVGVEVGMPGVLQCGR
jgi:hypothetical protein